MIACYIGARLVHRHPDLFNWTQKRWSHDTMEVKWVGIEMSHTYTTAHAHSLMSPLQFHVIHNSQIRCQINAKTSWKHIQ